MNKKPQVVACIPAHDEEMTMDGVVVRALNYVDRVVVCDARARANRKIRIKTIHTQLSNLSARAVEYCHAEYSNNKKDKQILVRGIIRSINAKYELPKII